ncbi:MAG: hypothetical protein PHI27_05395 [Eubacteriales bacterium]|nr:hypothetical protein [Eubacteriales bacterium]MDD3881669.1 hypothetical protein [Eubacteriales bacterium]MDD4512272.1 hypothetical protein [Eubacteriales bacterium]
MVMPLPFPLRGGQESAVILLQMESRISSPAKVYFSNTAATERKPRAAQAFTLLSQFALLRPSSAFEQPENMTGNPFPVAAAL